MKRSPTDPFSAQDAVESCDAQGIRLRVINGSLRRIVPPGKTISPALDLAIRRNEAELLVLLGPTSGMREVDPATGEIHDDDLPRIDAGNHDVREVAQQAWGALVEANIPPRLFRYAGGVSRLETEDGRAVLRPLTEQRLRHELARVADWFVMKKSGAEPAKVPVEVVQDMLATPTPPLPVVERMTHAPYFAPDGQLVTAAGYDAGSRTILLLDDNLKIDEVPSCPTNDNIARARTLILDELFADFPFVADADRANAVALALLPYVRPMIKGPTPNHLIEAPTAGGGKGLLADVATRPAIGAHVGVITGARDDDEWRKRLSSKLREGVPVILLDNITRTLDSGSLASAITTDVWSDRLLGTNDLMNVPVRCVWVTTANNPTMTTEIARRSIRIRLDPKIDRPWQRTGFRHPNLVEWADQHRAELIHAALVLIQAWIAAGKPKGTVTLGSFERWAGVMGGILDIAGVSGFLDNLDEFYEAADLEGAIWRQFVALWWEQHEVAEVGVGTLFNLTSFVEGFDLGNGGEKAQRTSFGMQLGKQRDRVIGNYRIVFARVTHQAKMWRLIPTMIDPLLPSDPHDRGNLSEKGSPPDFPCDIREGEEAGEPTGTISHPSSIENNSFSYAGQSEDRFPQVPPPTDGDSCGKGNREGNLSEKGSPDRAALLAWAEEAALGWVDDK